MVPARSGTSLNDRVVKYYQDRAGQNIRVEEVLQGLGGKDQRPTLLTTLSVLSRKGFLVRSEPGVYRLAEPGEAERAAAARKRSANKAERAERGEAAGKAAKKATVKATPGKQVAARAATGQMSFASVGTLRDGRTLLEDENGALWSAVQLVEERK